MEKESEKSLLVERDGEGIKFLGWKDYYYVHEHGLRHMTVQIIPIVRDAKGEVEIVVHRRSQDRMVGGGKFDCCGGHIKLKSDDNKYAHNGTDDVGFLEYVSLDTALDETNEEIVLRPSFRFDKSDLRPLGKIGEFEVDTERRSGGRNVEISSAYVLEIPSSHEVVEISEGRRDGTYDHMPVSRFSLDQLAEMFDTKAYALDNNDNEFADGMGRILEKVCSSDSFRREFESVIKFKG